MVTIYSKIILMLVGWLAEVRRCVLGSAVAGSVAGSVDVGRSISNVI